MLVTQFEAIYEELSKFFKYLNEIHDEARKAMNYERCLRPELKDRVATLEIRDFAKLINKVRIVKGTLEACKVKSAQKSKKKGFNETSRDKGG